MTREESVRLLVDAGAVNEVKEDQFGDTKSGWWQDTVYLGRDPREAWNLLNGN